MPIYEYRCASCRQTFEVIQKFSDPPVTTCAHCSGPLEKLVSRTSFHLKGGGWFNSAYGASPAEDAGGKTEKEKTDGKKSKGDDTSAGSSGGGCGSGACGCSG